MNNLTQPIMTSAALLALMSASAFAQSTDSTSEPKPEPSESIIASDGKDIVWSIYSGTSFSNEADFDDDSGTLQSTRTKFGVGAEMDLGEGRWSIGFDSLFTNYDFTTVSGGGGGPVRGAGGGGGGGGVTGVFGDVTSLTLNTMYRGRIDDENSWFIGGSVNSAYESGAEFDDSISGGVFGGYRHKVTDKLDLGIGLLIKSRLEDDVLILPLPQVRYDMGNGWTLESQRVGLKIMYAMNNELTFGVSGEYESHSFRLDEANAIPGGAATETRIPVAFQVDYKPNKKFSLHGRIGAALASDLEFFDAAGNTVSERDLDTSIFFGFGGSFRF